MEEQTQDEEETCQFFVPQFNLLSDDNSSLGPSVQIEERENCPQVSCSRGCGGEGVRVRVWGCVKVCVWICVCGCE